MEALEASGLSYLRLSAPTIIPLGKLLDDLPFLFLQVATTTFSNPQLYTFETSNLTMLENLCTCSSVSCFGYICLERIASF